MIFVTPYLWGPGMKTPILETGAFEIYSGPLEIFVRPGDEGAAAETTLDEE